MVPAQRVPIAMVKLPLSCTIACMLLVLVLVIVKSVWNAFIGVQHAAVVANSYSGHDGKFDPQYFLLYV